MQTVITSDRWQSKTLILSTNVDHKSLKTEFLIYICRQLGDKWYSKTLFLAFLIHVSSIVKSVFDCRLPGVVISCNSNEVSERLFSFAKNEIKKL